MKNVQVHELTPIQRAQVRRAGQAKSNLCTVMKNMQVANTIAYRLHVSFGVSGWSVQRAPRDQINYNNSQSPITKPGDRPRC